MEDEEIHDSILKLQQLSITNDEPHLSDLHHDSTIIRLLLKAKRGDLTALHTLESRACEFGERSLFHTVILLSHSSPRLSLSDRHNLQRVLDSLLSSLGEVIVRPHTRSILHTITPVLVSDDPLDNDIARNIVWSLTSLVGLQFIIDLVEPDILGFNEQCRLRAVQVLTGASSSSGIASILPFLSNICSSSNPGSARETGFKIVQQIALINGPAILPHLSELLRIVSKEMDVQSNTWTVRAAALAIDSIVQAVHVYGMDEFGWVVPVIFRCMKIQLSRNWMKSVEACAKAIGSIVEQTEDPMKSLYIKELMEILCCKMFMSENLDEELRRGVMGVYKQCVGAEGVSGLDVMRWIDDECVFKGFWAKSRELDAESCSILLDATVEITKKIGVREVMKRVRKEIEGGSCVRMEMVMPMVAKAVACREAGDDVGFDELVLNMHRLFSPHRFGEVSVELEL